MALRSDVVALAFTRRVRYLTPPVLVLALASGWSGAPYARAARANGKQPGMCFLSPTGAGPNVLESLKGDVEYAVSVTPKGGTATWSNNTSGHTAAFRVTNTGTCPDTYNFTSSTTGPVTGVTLSQTSASLAAGAWTTVTATYSVTTIGTGRLTLTASATTGSESDNGYYNVNVSSLVLSLAPHNGDYLDVTKCVAGCFDATAGYSAAPYVSWDRLHSVQLIYRYTQAAPQGLVQVNMRDTSSTPDTTMSIRLKDSHGAYVTFAGGSTEIFYAWTAHPADSNVNRLAAVFDATPLPTGAYNDTVVVRAYKRDGSFLEYGAPVRILIVNEAGSPFGAGWSIVGFQRLYLQADGSVVITEGNGSIAYFAPQAGCSYSCTFTTPRGDFTTLTSRGSGTDPLYDRTYPDGTVLSFHPDGRLAYVRDRFGNQTTYGYNASNLLVAITDPSGMADSLGYDGRNKLIWVKDPGGRTDSITVSSGSDLTVIKDWGGGLPFQGTYGMGVFGQPNHVLQYWYDRRGGAWNVSYDNISGKLGTLTAPTVTVNGQSVRPVVGYAAPERMILPSGSSGTSSNPAPNVDTATIRASTTNARGLATTYALDRFGAPTLVREPLGRTTTISRDSNSHVLRVASPSGAVARLTWSGPDLTQVWDSIPSRSRIVNYTYERFYHQLTSMYGDVDSLINSYSQGRLDSSRVGGSSVWTKYTYYAATKRDSLVTDPGGHTTAFYYHSSGLMNTDSTVRGGYTPESYQYDGHGQRTMIAHATNYLYTGQWDTTWIQYDSIGRAVRSVGPLHDTTVTTYDALYVTQVMDAKGQVYRSWVNALGWPDSATDAAGAVARLQYDSAGHLTRATNRRGQTIQFTFDSLGHVRFRIVGSDTTKFYTNPLDSFTVASNRESIDTIRFDPAGRQLLEISCRVVSGSSTTRCFRDSSAYETRDRRTALVARADSAWGVGVQRTLRWHYNNAAVLDTLVNFAGEPATFGYDNELFGNAFTLSGLNGLSISYAYPWTHGTDIVQVSDTTLNKVVGLGYWFDAKERVQARFHGPDGTPDTNRTYTYDRASRLISYADSSHRYAPNGGCRLHLPGDTCSGYDTARVVTSARYWYDIVGNRKDSAATIDGSDPGNRLRRLANFRMDYDADGNLVRKRTLNLADTTRVMRTDSLFFGAVGSLDSAYVLDSL